jgi:putative transcriptional regulator
MDLSIFSVILLADHDEEGSVGFIINKPLKYTINDLLPEINASLKFIMVGL